MPLGADVRFGGSIAGDATTRPLARVNVSLPARSRSGHYRAGESSCRWSADASLLAGLDYLGIKVALSMIAMVIRGSSRGMHESVAFAARPRQAVYAGDFDLFRLLNRADEARDGGPRAYERALSGALAAGLLRSGSSRLGGRGRLAGVETRRFGSRRCKPHCMLLKSPSRCRFQCRADA